MTLAAALLCSAACDRYERDIEAPVQEGELSVSIDLPAEPDTRVTPYTTVESGEDRLGALYLMVFDAGTYKLEAYRCFSSASAMAGEKITLLPGKKLVRVGANCEYANAQNMTEDSEFTSYRFSLLNDKTNWLQMAGMAYCTVTAGAQASCSVSLERIVARVSLTYIRNATSSSITIHRAFLSNVANRYTLSSGDVTLSSDYYNIQGRSDRTQSHIIDGSSYTAAASDLTYRNIGLTLASGAESNTRYRFYCYQNEATTAPAGFTSTYSGEYTTLVVVATVDGTLCYYPVVLDPSVMGTTYSVERNRAYTVGLTISGPGSPDPNDPDGRIETTQSASFTISVADWKSGASYTEEI